MWANGTTANPRSTVYTSDGLVETGWDSCKARSSLSSANSSRLWGTANQLKSCGKRHMTRLASSYRKPWSCHPRSLRLIGLENVKSSFTVFKFYKDTGKILVLILLKLNWQYAHYQEEWLSCQRSHTELKALIPSVAAARIGCSLGCFLVPLFPAPGTPLCFYSIMWITH